MDAKKYLYQFRILTKALEEENLALEALHSTAERMTTSYSAVPAKMNPHSRAMENSSTAIQLQKELIDSISSDREALLKEMQENIIKYGGLGAGVLVHYYINDLTLDAIGFTCGRKSRQWALNKRKEGERMIQKAMEEHPDSFHFFDLSLRYAELSPEKRERGRKKEG